MKENDLRDFLFKNYKNNIYKLIEHQNPAPFKTDEFLRISDLLRIRTEKRICNFVKRLELLSLDGKEICLVRDGDTTTRIDLLGHYEEDGGLVIIELKKSTQTERQAFTQLLSYANHFCTLFPSLSESSLSSILVAPMTGRSIRDALAQELIINHKNILALTPTIDGGAVSLSPFYPGDLYYRWIENTIVGDEAFTVVTASFPLIDGWIDAGEVGDGTPPDYTQDAFQIMTGIIAQKVEALGLHGFVYARQYWNELCPLFPHPNTIILCLLNPFSLFHADIHEGEVYGASEESRLSALQALTDQLDEKEDWFYNLYSSFQGQAIRIVQKAFEEFFENRSGNKISPEISLPNWRGFKESMLESVTCHNMCTRVCGLLRYLFSEYMEHCYNLGMDHIYFSDDLPKFGYLAHDNFLAVWEILRGLSEADFDFEDD